MSEGQRIGRFIAVAEAVTAGWVTDVLWDMRLLVVGLLVVVVLPVGSQRSYFDRDMRL